MGTIKDVRKVIQDLVAPDLKALDVRITALDHKIDLKGAALDQKIDLKFDLLDQKISGMDQKIKGLDQKIDGLEQKMDQKINALDQKFELKFDRLSYEIRTLAETVAMNHVSLIRALDVDRRLDRIENERALKSA